MLLDILFSGDGIQSALISLLLTLPIMMLALSAHETAHGYVAYKCGDPTAYNLGRLTLNPIKHLDPIGFACLMLFGFGWAKPVPINTRNFRNPKRGMALSALAGPLTNLLLGVICAALYGVTAAFLVKNLMLSLTTEISAFTLNLLQYLTVAFQFGAYINFLYMAFNLIPVPPFDGSRIALAFLPTKIYFKVMRYERQIMYGILITLFVLSYLGLSPFDFIYQSLTNLIAEPILKAILS
jgi:Zn-dependent protease